MKKKYYKIVIFPLFLIILLMFYTMQHTDNIEKISESILIKLYGVAIKEDGTINNNYFGIKNDATNSKETTKGINNAINYANKKNIKYLKFEKGEYLINGSATENVHESDKEKGIILKSNIILDLNGAKFIQETTNTPNYAIFTITNVENVTIKNGMIIGDRENHIYTSNYPTHEWGFGIDIRSRSINIQISNLEIYNLTGDGIYIGNNPNLSKYNAVPTNITICDSIIYNCRRQGISILCSDNLRIYNNHIYKISGTRPESTLDIEPWNKNQIVQNVKIYNNKMEQYILIHNEMENLYNIQINDNILYKELDIRDEKNVVEVYNNKMEEI